MAQWAKTLGAETVVVMGRNPEKLEKSLQYGVDFTISLAGKTPFDVKKEFFGECRRRKLDPKYGWKIFEMSGYREGQEAALDLIGYAGMLVVVGYGSDTLPYHLSRLMAFDAEIRGTWGCLPEYYPAILERVLAGEVAIDPFLETRPMSKISETFEELGRAGSTERRIVLTPDF